MRRSLWLAAVLGVVVLAAFGFATLSVSGEADDDNDNENEQQISVDELPAAVKAAIKKAAQGARIEEVERETENGKTVYEVELVVETEMELELTEDGTIVGFELDGPDDDASGDEDDD